MNKFLSEFLDILFLPLVVLCLVVFGVCLYCSRPIPETVGNLTVAGGDDSPCKGPYMRPIAKDRMIFLEAIGNLADCRRDIEEQQAKDRMIFLEAISVLRGEP